MSTKSRNRANSAGVSISQTNVQVRTLFLLRLYRRAPSIWDTPSTLFSNEPGKDGAAWSNHRRRGNLISAPNGPNQTPWSSVVGMMDADSDADIEPDGDSDADG